MNKINPVIIAAIKKNNTFLLTKRVHLDPEDKRLYHGAWQLPGGSMNFGEAPEEALHREIKEELGVAIKIVKCIPKVYTEVRKYWQGLFIVYICKLKDTHPKIILDDEASEYRWVSLEESRKLKTLAGTTQIMKDALKIGADERSCSTRS